MPAKSEKARRRSIVMDVARRERTDAEARMPITSSQLECLFDYLDESLKKSGRDHTLRFTREFLTARELPADPIAQWLGEYGGFCDCEVLGNVEETWSRSS
jgi:uncharacterized protein DUF2695